MLSISARCGVAVEVVDGARKDELLRHDDGAGLERAKAAEAASLAHAWDLNLITGQRQANKTQTYLIWKMRTRPVGPSARDVRRQQPARRLKARDPCLWRSPVLRRPPSLHLLGPGDQSAPKKVHFGALQERLQEAPLAALGSRRQARRECRDGGRHHGRCARAMPRERWPRRTAAAVGDGQHRPACEREKCLAKRLFGNSAWGAGALARSKMIS